MDGALVADILNRLEEVLKTEILQELHGLSTSSGRHVA
jgi:hypothetical protein